MTILRRLQISHRLWLLIGLSILGLASVTVLALSDYRSGLLQEKKIQIRKLVESAHSIVDHHYRRATRGEIDMDIARQAALDTLKAIRYDGDNYVWVNDMQPRMVMHPIKPELDGRDLTDFKDPNGKRLFVAFVDTVRAAGSGTVPYLWPRPGDAQPVEKISYVQGFAPWGWIIGTGIYVDDVARAFWQRAVTLTAIAGVALLSLLVSSFLITRSIVCPLKASAQAMIDIAHGEGDLTRRLDDTGGDELAAMARAFNQFAGTLQRTVIQVGDASQRLGVFTTQMCTQASNTARGIEHQRNETHQIATAITEMAATVLEIARSAESAAASAHEADREATRGHQIVNATSQAITGLAHEMENASAVINRLESETEAIGSVLDVIRGIAEQTNLLALNAAIEAARAGEQGRGFAVVADEVRTLASRTQQSTREIQQMIERLQHGSREAVQVMHNSSNTTKDTVTKVQNAATSLTKIVTAIGSISDMNTQIAGAAEEQSAVAQELDRGIVQISRLAEQSAEDSASSHCASGELRELGKELHGLIGQFKVA